MPKTDTIQWRVTWQCNKAGQPRPYADHAYEYEFWFMINGYGKSPARPIDFNPIDKTRQICATIAGLKEKEDCETVFEQHVTGFRQVGPGHYIMTGAAAYTG